MVQTVEAVADLQDQCGECPAWFVETRLSAPAKQIPCAAFGGSNLTELYMTSAAKSEPMPLMPPCYDAEHGCFGGPLYRVRLNVLGQMQEQANIRKPVGGSAA